MDVEKEIEDLRRQNRKLSDSVEQLNRQKRLDRLTSGIAGIAKHMVPKGFRNPDDTITHKDWYIPRRRKRRW